MAATGLPESMQFVSAVVAVVWLAPFALPGWQWPTSALVVVLSGLYLLWLEMRRK